jgi:peptidoglycan/LPS O-acetylase OafA/YrhL
MKYRRDIDGLRALAVLPVVLFHAAVPFISGGFVGVDVFFVISGFLITRILIKDFEGSRWTVTDFYKKRMDRLFPVLAAVLVVTTVVSVVLMTATEVTSFLKSALASILFSSNLFFWVTSDYFAPSAFTKPLLHTWSLGVEDQFYLIYPWILLLFFKYGIVKKGLAVMLVVSLAAACLIVQNSTASVFYLLPFRAWELLAGAMLAVGAFKFLDTIRRQYVLAWLGFFLVVVSFFALNKGSVFPAWNALPAVVGAVLLISVRSKGVLLDTLFENRMSVLIGKSSYSIYLWHWPIIVLFGLSFGEFRPLLVNLAVALITILLGIMSWFFIEGYSKGRISRLSFPRAALVGALIFLPVVVLSLYGLGTGNIGIERLNSPSSFVDDAIDYSPERERCHASDTHRVPYGKACILGDQLKAPSVAVWGDSHGVEISYVLGQRLAKQGGALRQLTYSACLPIIRDNPSSGKAGCQRHNLEVMDNILADSNIRVVILEAYYPGANKLDATTAHGFRESVRRLVAGGKNVILNYPLPRTYLNIPFQAERESVIGFPRTKIATEDFLVNVSSAIALLEGIASDYAQSDVIVLDSYRRLCRDVCYFSDDSGSYFFDGHHISLYGARFIVDDYVQALASFAGG